MAWRFKVSKYKNAVGVVPRKEDWLTDIKVGSPQSCGNHVRASAAFMAFNVENRGGGSLGVMPLSAKGRFDPNSPLLHAHSDLITDFDFSPFDDGMLATGSTDAYVHVWHIPEGGLRTSLSTPEYSLPQFDKRVENVLFHPTVEFLLSVTYYDTVKLWDILHQKEIACCKGAQDQIQGTSWKADGSLIVTNAKDKTVRVHDPRVAPSESVVLEAASHPSPKDSRVVWLGSTDTILTTGYNQNRVREVILRDVRSFNKPFKTQGFDSSTGILMPLYDADTNMLFLAGKADVSIMYWEVSDKDPFLTEGLKHNGNMQTKGACLVPKRGVDVMSGEVNRVLQLTSNTLIPIAYQVPRKTYREFHTDLFPETQGCCSGQTIGQWCDGGNVVPQSVSLDPAHRSTPTLQVHRGPIVSRQEMDSTPAVSTNGAATNGTNGVSDGTNGAPVPAPRSRISNGSSIDSNKSNESTSNKPPTLSKPTVAVKPSLMAPKPAARSTVPQNNRERCYNQLNSSDQDNNTVVDGSDDIIKDTQDNSKTNSSWKQDEQLSCTKLASIRAQFESLGLEDNGKTTNSDVNGCKNTVPIVKDTVVAPSGAVLPTVTPSTGTSSSPVLQRRNNSTSRTRSFRRICKFRHLKGTPGHRSTQIENLRDLCRTIASESDGITCNSKYVVLPLTGAGGRVSVINHQRGGRLPDGVIPAFLCGQTVLDFALDPFDESVLLTACDDGKILEWHIPEDGLLRPCNEPNKVFCDSADKVTMLKHHPLAAGVLAAACGDFTIRIWDLTENSVAIQLDPHPDQIFSMCWSPCGVYLATLCRDGRVRVFDPRKSSGPCREGPGPQGVRGGRVLWALDGSFIITTGSSKTSERQVALYKASDLSAPVMTVPLDHSPAILMPYYDPDSNTLFVTAKGESTIHCYEVGSDSPHLFPLSHHKASSVHQGLTFLPKHTCDVRVVEFAKALRLTQSTLEPLSFTVPRVRTTLFQDDLFPPTPARWLPSLTAGEWLAGKNTRQQLVSLQPNDMVSLSAANNSPPSSASAAGSACNSPASESAVSTPVAKDNSTSVFIKNLPTEVRQTQLKLEQSMSEQIIDGSSCVLQQDTLQGVETEEWAE